MTCLQQLVFFLSCSFVMCWLHYHCYVVTISLEICTNWRLWGNIIITMIRLQIHRVGPHTSHTGWAVRTMYILIRTQQHTSVGLQSVIINKARRYAERDH